MAGVSVTVSGVSISDALGIIAPGERARVMMTIENTIGKAVTGIRLWLEAQIGSTSYRVSDIVVDTGGIANGEGLAGSFDFVALGATQGAFAALRAQGLRGKKELVLSGSYTL